MKPTINTIAEHFKGFNLSDEAINEISNVAAKCYEYGEQQGIDDMIMQLDEDHEKIGVEYAVEAFSECRDLNDYQDKQRELTNRACNFMPTLGL